MKYILMHIGYFLRTEWYITLVQDTKPYDSGSGTEITK